MDYSTGMRLLELERELQRREAIKRFPVFLDYSNPSYSRQWFHTLIAEKCQQLIQGTLGSDRLMLFMPPQHGKSEVVSRKLPAWALGYNPLLKIVGTSYSADLAQGFSRSIQRTIDSTEYSEVFPNTFLNNQRIKNDDRRSWVRNVVANYSNNVNYLKSIFNSLPEAEVKLNSEGRDPQYVETILGRARKVTDEFSQTYTPMGQNLRNIVANRYFELNDIYAERDSLKKTDKKLAEAVCDSKLYRSHFAFDANLAKYLDPSRIERVKDVMTFNVVKVTYEAQCDMIPTLKDEEKQQILLWLKEARELAIDAESSKKKHEVFGKYKGRINNYLSKRGYDLTKEREEWYKRVKARGGQL